MMLLGVIGLLMAKVLFSDAHIEAQACERINHLLDKASEISDNQLLTGDFNA